MGLTRPAAVDLVARLFGASPPRTLALLRATWPLAAGPELARRTEVLAAIDFVGLTASPKAKVGSLGARERRLVEIARAVVGSPRLVLLDEWAPERGTDAELSRDLRRWLAGRTPEWIAVDPASVGRVDAVLLSHHQHPDNLDHGGRRFLRPGMAPA